MTASTRILVIEDEPAIADTLVYALRTEGFAPEWCATGRAGLEAFARETCALVILDVGLPDMSGFELCRELRTRATVPVLFLTARSGEIDRVVGLELGGDDYVTKPFSPREVTARVRAILRRTQAGGIGGMGNGTEGTYGTNGATGRGEGGKQVCHLLSDKRLDNVGLKVDVECKKASWGGVGVELTRYEFRLLAVLAGRPGRVWSRDELMARVWEDPGASLDRTVDAHIKTLRAKLRAVAGAAGEAIQTHRGEGYSLREGVIAGRVS
jgi:two-component system catabolic regulation response regulator CreB